MKDQTCKVTVHNVPEHAEGYIVARLSNNALWYWGCFENEDDAVECARNVEGVVVREAKGYNDRNISKGNERQTEA